MCHMKEFWSTILNQWTITDEFAQRSEMLGFDFGKIILTALWKINQKVETREKWTDEGAAMLIHEREREMWQL